MTTQAAVNFEDLPSDVRRGLSRSRRKHKALPRLHAQGVTVAALAKELDVSRTTASAWFATSSAARPIPKRYALAIRLKYKVPLTVWARVV